MNEIIRLTDPQVNRDNTFEFISWWDRNKIKNATVMVIGAGALGNEVLKNFALLGIGRILVIDFDVIVASNLSRSILFRESDIGKKKAQIAARSIKKINPDVKVKWLHSDVNHEIGLGIYRRMDAVIGCLDNRQARLSINQSCWKVNKPWIDGGLQELLGVGRIFDPKQGVCYECTLGDDDYKVLNARKSCQDIAIRDFVEGKVPTAPTISSIIAGYQAQEAVKLIHKIKVQPGRGFVFNGLINDMFFVEYSPREDCLSHWTFSEIVELKSKTNKTLVGDVLDVAADTLGDSCFLQVPRFIISWSCGNCGYSENVGRPAHRLFHESIFCPKCGELMNLNQTERIGKEDRQLLTLPLAQIGIPQLDIVVASNSQNKFIYLELTGDSEVLKFK